MARPRFASSKVSLCHPGATLQGLSIWSVGGFLRVCLGCLGGNSNNALCWRNKGRQKGPSSKVRGRPVRNLACQEWDTSRNQPTRWSAVLTHKTSGLLLGGFQYSSCSLMIPCRDIVCVFPNLLLFGSPSKGFLLLSLLCTYNSKRLQPYLLCFFIL